MGNTSKSRIIKNTGYLYLRMLVTMGVGLYTSRVVLDVLGVEDYGLYNVVSSFIIFFSFFNSIMATSTQRFLNYETGSNNSENLQKIFGLSFSLHMLIALILLVLSETIGLWFVNNKLNIPLDRMVAVNWVYQFSIFGMIVSILSSPYIAVALSREKFNVISYITIAETMLKLLVVYLLVLIDEDKLILYSSFIFLISFLSRIAYYLYATRNFKESHFLYYWNKDKFKELVFFSFWNLWGGVAKIGYSQGVNILINIFCGATVNAARAIAFQVMGAVNSLVSNFQLALNPPITKSFAAGEKERVFSLICYSSKYSFFLLSLISLPFIIETKFILHIWLKEVPEYTESFTRLILIDTLIVSLSGPLSVLSQASGRVKSYFLTISFIALLNLPISYFLLKNGIEPESTFVVSIALSLVALFAQLLILKFTVELKIKEFLRNSIFPVFLIASTAWILPVIYKESLKEESWLNFLSVCFLSIFSTLVLVIFLGLSKKERIKIYNYIKKYLSNN